MHPSPFSVAAQNRATSPLSPPLPLRIHSLLAAIVADFKGLLHKGRQGRRSKRDSLDSTTTHPSGSWFHSRHPSDLESEYTRASVCNTESTMPVKKINYVSSHVIGGVKSIPRKAGKLVCISDSGHSPVEVVLPLPSDRSSGSSDTATMVSTSTSSGASGSHVACRPASVAPKASQASMASSVCNGPVPYRPGPIITVEQLQKAMDRKSMTFESSFNAADVVSVSSTPIQSPKPRASNGLSVEVVSSYYLIYSCINLLMT